MPTYIIIICNTLYYYNEFSVYALNPHTFFAETRDPQKPEGVQPSTPLQQIEPWS